jgi:hypothetical protein
MCGVPAISHHLVEPDEDKCRPVEVDGEIIRVHGDGEMDALDREMFAEVVRAAKRKWVAEYARRKGDRDA